MTLRTPKAKRLRRHGDAPANWQYRANPDGSGRPRWIPSPTLRKAGWRPHDLKDAAGVFLSEGLSRDLARDINAQVAAWRRGELVSADYAPMAPEGAAEQVSILPQATDRLSIGRLIDAYLDSKEVKGVVDPRTGKQIGGLKPSTQAGYRKSLKRLVDTLAGFVILPDGDDPDGLDRYAMAYATVRASLATVLEPVEIKTGAKPGMVNLLYTAYWNLNEHAGLHQAYAVLAAASAWLKWVQKHQSATIRRDWASDVSRITPPGRVRPLTWAEVRALIEAADEMGLPSIGDAILLGVDLSWSQIDRLALPWNRLKDFRALTGGLAGDEGRAKTGKVGGTPLTGLGRARVAQILERQRAMPARPTHVIWSELTSAPWEGDHYRKTFAKVRLRAAVNCPSLLVGPPSAPNDGATDQDLRDTAFTWMKNAGMDDDRIASRTLQSRKHIGDLGDKHYGEIGPEISDHAAAQLDGYFKKMGMAL